MIAENLLASRWLRVCVSAAVAMMFYGAWAYWINSGYGDAALKAALVQGLYSFVLTLMLSSLIEWLFQYFRHRRYRVGLIILLVCSLLYSTSWFINRLAMTPDILFTILPGALMSTVFTVFYVFGLKRLDADY